MDLAMSEIKTLTETSVLTGNVVHDPIAVSLAESALEGLSRSQAQCVKKSLCLLREERDFDQDKGEILREFEDVG